MSNLINKVKDSMSSSGRHSDRSGHSSDDYTSPTGTHVDDNFRKSGATYGGTTSPYGANQTTSPIGGNTYDNPRSTNDGPHSSNMANKVDPRVDSDRDGRGLGTTGTGYGNTGTTGTGYGNTGTTGTTGTGLSGNSSDSAYGSVNRKSVPASGPHNSNFANKLDPRVDSDRDGRSGLGNTGSAGTGYGNTGTGYGNTGTTGTDYGNTGTTGTGYGNTGATGGGILGAATTDHTTHRGDTGTTEHDTRHTGAGYGSSNVETSGGKLSNEQNLSHTTRHAGGGTYDSSATHRSADGHYDSSKTTHSGPGVHESSTYTTHGVGNTQSTTHNSAHTSGNPPPGAFSNTPGSGNAQNTAGPHNSNMMNKLDPRVDSDRDGSKTYGGNQTYR